MVQLEEWRTEFEDLGVSIAAMTYDSLEILRTFHEREQLGYPLLRDADARHVEAFGIRDQNYEKGDQAYGVPNPGIFWLAPDGRVVEKFAVPGYRTRPSLAEVLASISATLDP